MKKLILALLAIFLMIGMAYASPFLICDDPPAEQQVTGYEIFQDGVSIGTTPAPLMFDLQGVATGEYTFTATAINVWGASQPSNPYISPQIVAPPLNLNITP